MFWKPTMPLLPIVYKRNALDVNLSPAHPKKIRKDDQSLQVTVNGKNVEKSFVSMQEGLRNSNRAIEEKLLRSSEMEMLILKLFLRKICA